jgi:hypothetical protein
MAPDPGSGSATLVVHPEAEFLDEIQTIRVLIRVFLLASGYSLSPLQLCLEISMYFFKLTQPLTVSTVQSLYTVKEKGGKPYRKPYPLP